MTMTLQQFHLEVKALKEANSTYRHGQAAFNHLHSIRPDLAENVHGTDMDPFYLRDEDRKGSKCWQTFTTFLTENW